MASPLFVVVQGAPGSGKSTLLKHLKPLIDIPVLGKDDIKEFLFDTVPQSDRDFSRLEGRAAIVMLFAFARTLLQHGHDVLIEGAFMPVFARPDLTPVLDATNARFVEIYCHTDEATRVQRFKERAASGERHPAHLDSGATHLNGAEGYGPLELGELLSIDMTDAPEAERYREIADFIRERLTGKENE